jgi:hypothetical protein
MIHFIFPAHGELNVGTWLVRRRTDVTQQIAELAADFGVSKIVDRAKFAIE